MDARQSRSFTNFAFGFIAIIALAFGVLMWVGSEQEKVQAVDNVARPD